MILMALDHVRDYFHADAFVHSPTDLAHTTPALFFTRWVTHYCAPVFVFLAGVSARLYGATRSRRDLSRFLLTRGLWLVCVELFVVSLFRTFNPAYPFWNLQVIWAIGVSMIALAAMTQLSERALLATGLVIVGAHDLLDSVHVAGDGVAAFLWALLHDRRVFACGHATVRVSYPLLPWIGTMALGYACGRIHLAGWDTHERRRSLRHAGWAAVAFFVVVRAAHGYGDPADWAPQTTILFTLMSFLNVTKYPPSLLYLTMTLGPALLFLASEERAAEGLSARIRVFGRVPMFYYLAHILLIHVLATVAAVASGRGPSAMVLASDVTDAPMLRGYGFGLAAVYGIWVVVVAALYPCCKWYDGYKRRHLTEHAWLSYL